MQSKPTSYSYPPDLQSGVNSYSWIFNDNTVSPELVDAMMEQVQVWTRDDICVYAFRFPASSEVMALENRLSGFDEADVRTHLQESGVIWIDVDPSSYIYYDGSHLHMDSARQFSRDIAEMMRDNPC